MIPSDDASPYAIEIEMASEFSDDETVASETFVDVAVDLQTSERRRLLTYAVPAHLTERIAERQLVLVPVRRDRKLGVVVRVHHDRPEFDLRGVQAIAEPDYALSQQQWNVIEWLAEETICTLYEAASPFFPPGINQKHVDHLHLTEGGNPEDCDLTSKQRELVTFLSQRGEVSVDVVRRAFKSKIPSVISKLEKDGVIERVARIRPGRGSQRKTRFICRTDQSASDFGRAHRQKRALEVIERRLLLSHGRPIPLDDVVRRLGVTQGAIKSLAEKGLIEFVDIPLPVIYQSSDGSPDARYVQLTLAQGAVWTALSQAMRTGIFAEYLLHGVTSSGKTEIYLRSAAWNIARGRQVIILVPEIALATQLVERFAARFPGQVALLHSNLPDGERYAVWQAVRNGTIPIVVGARSALFAPVPNLGLVVIDEEHESTYKQESNPRYHARDVARKLTQLNDAVLLLGSATPDVVTYKRAVDGDVRYLALSERIGPLVSGAMRGERAPLAMPETEVADMRIELQQGNTTVVSRALQERVEASLNAGEQSILFLNRRGLSTIIQCRNCGTVLECPHCDIPLVYHGDRKRAICHRCNYQIRPSTTCPECHEKKMSHYGSGTQRIELEARRAFPNARVLRWDHDAVRGGVTHRDLYHRVLRGEVDIVVGTQMVAKGFDFPGVSTIGVMNADTQLHLPDYRSAERTFQLITQVAGRAGRRASGARVVVQSYSPQHYAIQTALAHDYEGFVQAELAFREQFRYPPFTRLVRMVYRNGNEDACETAGNEMAELIAREAYAHGLHDLEILGPTPAFIAKIRNVYQWQLVLRGNDGPRVMRVIDPDPGWMVDVDPVNLL